MTALKHTPCPNKHTLYLSCGHNLSVDRKSKTMHAFNAKFCLNQQSPLNLKK